MEEHKIKIQNREFTLVRLKLKGWSMLEPLKKNLDIAISKDDPELIFNSMVRIIEMAIVPFPKVDWEKLPWWEFLEIYVRVIHSNSPTTEFPILKSGKPKEEKLPWEYDGRSWFFWLNVFAKNYGWDEETIANLDVDTAIGAYQEIALEEQLQKEWEWGLSEMTYSYDKSTKKSKAVPYPRPDWMKPMIPKQPKTIRMLKSHLPMGNVIDVQAQEMERRAKKKQDDQDT